RPEDEHRLLAACLGCFLRYEVLPQDVLAGALADQERPSHVHIALPPGGERNISDVWSALGGELKPSLDLVVTAPFVTGRSVDVGAPVLEGPTVRMRGEGVDEPVRAGPRAAGGRRVRVPARQRQVLAEEVVQGAGGEERTGRNIWLKQLEAP
ncbi:MAG TPA: Pvc16 family protein, partial [Acidimicrobiales bacterium]|nr:Pvc16 family protein [Acidimicrobiales bacterium]